MGWIHPDDETEAAALSAVHHLEALLMWVRCDVAPRHFFRVIAQERRLGRQALARRWDAVLVKLDTARAQASLATPQETVMRKPLGPVSNLVRVQRGSMCVVRRASSPPAHGALDGASGNGWVDAALERLLGPHLALVPAALRAEFAHHVRDLIADDPTLRRLVGRLRVAT